MKPLYKFKITNKKKRKKKISIPSLPYPLSNTRIPFLAGVVLRRTPQRPQGAHYCTYLKGPLDTTTPEMKAWWVDSQRR